MTMAMSMAISYAYGTPRTFYRRTEATYSRVICYGQLVRTFLPVIAPNMFHPYVKYAQQVSVDFATPIAVKMFTTRPVV